MSTRRGSGAINVIYFCKHHPTHKGRAAKVQHQLRQHMPAKMFTSERDTATTDPYDVVDESQLVGGNDYIANDVDDGTTTTTSNNNMRAFITYMRLFIICSSLLLIYVLCEKEMFPLFVFVNI